MAEELPTFLAGECLVTTKARLKPLFGEEETDRWHEPDEHREASTTSL